MKSYKRRQLADREKSLKGEMIISESGDGPNRLSTHVFFAKRFHMIVKFGWHLPLCPTEKKLKHCMKICAGKVDGVVGFDFTFTRTIDCVFDSTLSKMILIGTLAQKFSLNSKLVVQREMHGDYVIAFVKKEDATKFATDLIMSIIKVGSDCQSDSPDFSCFCVDQEGNKLDLTESGPSEAQKLDCTNGEFFSSYIQECALIFTTFQQNNFSRVVLPLMGTSKFPIRLRV